MGVIIPAALASTLADDAIAAIDAGGAAATIKIYAGTLPADLNPGTDVELLELTLAYPAAPGSTAGVATFDVTTPPSGTVLADGTPGYFLVVTSTPTVALGGVVGITGDPAADLTFASVTWITGETVTLDAGTLTMPTTGG